MDDGRPTSEDLAKYSGSAFIPSSAADVLADLSRLQKEVDDLRGQYEGRKQSQ
jgi:hypothetical protein